jgi:hypothetical protein
MHSKGAFSKSHFKPLGHNGLSRSGFIFRRVLSLGGLWRMLAAAPPPT